jgi:predicted TPR repeat methyltransferase
MKATGLAFADASVLDIGSGTGFFIERWKELGVRRIVGVDITHAAVENLRRKHPDAEFQQVDIGDPLPALPRSSFDAVSAFDVLYHIVDDARYETALANISSLLKPGGLFVWSDNFVREGTLRGEQQVSRSLESIERALLASGFQIVDRRPLFYLMNSPVDSRDPVKKLLWQALSTVVSKSEVAGYAVGALLYPMERLLTTLAKESPTTEIMFCRKGMAAPIG